MAGILNNNQSVLDIGFYPNHFITLVVFWKSLLFLSSNFQETPMDNQHVEISSKCDRQVLVKTMKKIFMMPAIETSNVEFRALECYFPNFG